MFLFYWTNLYNEPVISIKVSKLNIMKSVRSHVADGHGKQSCNKYSVKKKNICERPTPLDFDTFVPWFCLELQVPKNVIITRTNQAEYVRYGSKVSKDSSKSSKSKSKSTKIKLSTIKSDHTDNKSSGLHKNFSVASSTKVIQDAIPITTYYDKRGHLVEIEIIGCSFPIHRKVIQAFNVCLPFHLGLSKLSIKKGGVNHIVLYEISKLLPHSNITNICLDDSIVFEGNYSILLNQPSQVKYLSLKRCGINNEECKRIAEKIDLNGPAVKTLLLLDLSSNKIMDEGAKALGNILKKNRHLLYLNLCDNNVSDIGAGFILMYLKEFPLTFDDIKERRFRRLNYLKSKTVTYKRCLEEENLIRSNKNDKDDSSINQLHPIIDVPKHPRRKKTKTYLPSFSIEEVSVEDVAKMRTKEILGEFEDPFNEEYTNREGDSIYAISNLTLCSLNLAYNDLTLLSIRKILEVLKYQNGINKMSHNTGLMRIVIDGNNIPSRCNELNEIDMYLKSAILENDHNISMLSLTN